MVSQIDKTTTTRPVYYAKKNVCWGQTTNQYSLVETSCKKWPKNGSDPYNDEY
jgi:hypothetical protein